MVHNMKQIAETDGKAKYTRSSTGSVQSVQRALDLLEVFLEHGPEIGLSRIAKLLNLNKATAYRLLSNLEERGFIRRSPGSRKYTLGVKVFELGYYFQSQMGIRQAGLPYLKQLVELTNESGFLCVREGDEALCVERVESQREVNIFSLRVGGKQPLHCGGAPRALLVDWHVSELTGYAERTGLPAFTNYTIHTLGQLLEDVDNTRQQGYVVSMNDVDLGIAAVGAPIYDHTARVVASISLSGLSTRYNPERVAELGQIVKDMAKRFSRGLGFGG
jgi:IclR family transcriptional regulator, KDG regulon repressor